MAYAASVFSLLLREALCWLDSGGGRVYDRFARRQWRSVLSIHAALFAVLMATALIYGHNRVHSLAHQEAALLASDHSLHVTCLLRVSDPSAASTSWTEDALWAATENAMAASPHNGLVLWSEAALSTHSTSDEARALGLASAIARSGDSWLGISWMSHVGEVAHTMFALLAPRSGRMLVRYTKAHPVPLADVDVEAGPTVLSYAQETPWGRSTVAICFDMDFPDFVRHAGSMHTALVVQPAQTWGTAAFGERHFQGNSLRAVETGATVVRCGSDGVSGGVAPSGQMFGKTTTENKGTLSYEVPWPQDARKDTVFATAGGWLFGWACVAVTTTATATLATQSWRERRLMGQL